MDHYTETEALNKLQATLREHDLWNWRGKIEDAKSHGGICRYGQRVIALTRSHVLTAPKAEVDQTIIHEVAHALVGPGHGHGPVWRAKARGLGYTGGRTMSHEATVLMRSDSPWVGVCPNGHELSRYRKPGKAQSCSKCNRKFDERFLVVWYRRSERPAAVVVPSEPAWMAAARERGRKVIAANLAERP